MNKIAVDIIQEMNYSSLHQEHKHEARKMVERVETEIAPLIARINGIKATLSVYADAIAADMAMNDYIAELNELLNYSEDGTLELVEDTLTLIAEHERGASQIEMSKNVGNFEWCSNALKDIYGSFVDMKQDLPTLESLPAYQEMLDEQDAITRSDESFERDRHAGIF
jgi:hypothetical protein